MSVPLPLPLPLALVPWLVLAIACGDRGSRTAAPPSPLETAIARDLTARFGGPVATTCVLAGVTPVRCTAKLADGTELPIAIDNVSKEEWGWRVDGVVIVAASIVEVVRDGLDAVNVQQAVDCGPPIQVLPRGDRAVCKLAGGGAAFVAIADDGSTTLELALDPATAAARTELMTPDRDRELAQQSLALEPLAGQSDGEDAVAADAGVP